MITSAELVRMRDVYRETMPDTCIVLKAVTHQAPDGEVSTSWVERGAATPCGFKATSGNTIRMDGGQLTVITGDGEIRLPVDVAITAVDRIRLLSSFGEQLDAPAQFRILGEPRGGPAGTVVTVKRVEV